MMDLALAAYMAVDLHVVGRVGENCAGLNVDHERYVAGVIESVPTVDLVISERPDVTLLRNSRASRELEVVVAITNIFLKRLYTEIDLWSLKARRLDVEVQGEIRQFLELHGELWLVPSRSVRQLVVRKHVSFCLGFCEIIQKDDRKFG